MCFVFAIVILDWKAGGVFNAIKYFKLLYNKVVKFFKAYFIYGEFGFSDLAIISTLTATNANFLLEIKR